MARRPVHAHRPERSRFSSYGPVQEQQPERAQTRVHLVLLAAMHPELEMTAGYRLRGLGEKKGRL